MLAFVFLLAYLRHWCLRLIGVAHTKGFDPVELPTHWKKHGTDLGAVSMNDYEARADAFLGGPRPPAVLECHRAEFAAGIGSDTVRFNCATKEYGVLSAGN